MNAEATPSVAIVLGATTSVGRAVAARLAEAGARLALVGVAGVETASDLEEVASGLEGLAGEAMTTELAPRDRAGFESFFAEVADRHGRPDALVTVPGAPRPVPADQMSDADWDDAIDGSLSATYCAYRALLPHFESTGRGRVVSVVGDEGRRGAGGASHIAAGHWSIIGLAKSAALEMAESDVAVNVVTSTALDDQRWQDDAYQAYAHATVGEDTATTDRDSTAAALGLRHPTTRPFVPPDAVARAVMMFLTQPDNTMTGSVLDLSQGMAALNTA